MKKTFLAFAFLLFILPAVWAACSDSDQTLFRISNAGNAHAEVYDGAGSYSVELCYDTIFGSPYLAASPHTCSGTNAVVNLSSPTNAHVEQGDLAAYPEVVCFGDMTCEYVDGGAGNPDCSTWDIASECVATISSQTNAHISSECSGPLAYPIGVCCKSSVLRPVADAGPDMITATGSPVTLNGSCSDSDGTISSCVWTAPAGCIAGAPVEDWTDPANVKTSIDITCTGSVGDIFTVDLKAIDSAANSDTDTADIVISDFGTYLKIIRLSADPLTFDEPGLTFSSINVAVENISSTPVNALVRLEVLDPATNMPIVPPMVSENNSCGLLADGDICSLTEVAFSGIDISTIPGGSYKLQASVEAFSGKIDDQKALFFTIKQQTPVPETDLVLIAVIALSVIGIVFLSG